MIRYREISSFQFAPIFRVFISGCSASGKTFFAHQLLKSNLIKYDRVYYFHPDCTLISQTVLYHPGIPALEELLEIPEYSVLVFDDLMTQCCEAKQIDYLFRVLSSKRKLNVIIMTQRYFSNGRNGLSIRNSSNYHVLLRNADARTNQLVANSMQLKTEITKAQAENKSRLYPYIFIDRTNEARVNNLQIYTNLFSTHKEVIIGSMKYYLISESDFNQQYHCVGDNLAKLNEDKTNKLSSPGSSAKSCSEKSNEPSEPNQGSQGRYYSTVRERRETRRRIDREVQTALRRHKIKSKLQCQD